MAVCLCWAVAAAAAASPDARLQEAQAAFDEVGKLWDAGRYDDAIARGEQALALREAVLGPSHPDVAACLDLLGSRHLLRGNPVRAEPLLQRALAIREATLGTRHPDVARTLHTLAGLYAAQHLYDRAEPLHSRALAIRETALGNDHPDVADSLNGLANLYVTQRLHARAEPLFRRALAIREAALGKDHPAVAETLRDLGESYSLQGLYDQAEPFVQRSLAIREAALGNDHPDVADALWTLAVLYRNQGASERAEPLFARLVAIRKAIVDNDPPDLASSLLFLAIYDVTRGGGGSARAEPLLLRAVALREAALGKDHPLVADALNLLATFYGAHGLYGRAELALGRALAIWEATLGENHPLIANLLLDLGPLYVAQGLYARAEPLLLRALAIRKAAFGENSRFVATALLALGQLRATQGDHARAEPLLLRGLALREKTLGGNSGSVATALLAVGELYVAQGRYARAEPLFKRALAIQEAAFGRNHEAVSTPLNHLAGLYAAQGSYDRARPLYERALTILEATLGEHHPRVAETLNHLAAVHLAQRRLAKALPRLTRAFALSEWRLRQESLGFSEARLASFLQFLRADEERLYALLRAHPDDARVRRLALSATLLLKGRSVEETADISRTVYRSLDARDRDTFERLRELRTQLAQLSLQGPGPLAPAAYRQRLETLAEQGAALEADLARRSAPLRALASLPPPSEIVDRVAAALPEGTALVEFVTYVDRPLLPRPGAPGAHRSGQPRYLAQILLPDGTIHVRDLGPAGPIDAAATRLRDALANRDAGFQAAARTLHGLAFQPLLPLLGKARRLFLSPDGQLALVPFAVLHDGQRFLVDAFDFTSLPSGKHLLPRPRESAPDAVVVLADPDFGAPLEPPSHPAGGALAQAGHATAVERFFAALRADPRQRAWAPTPLPGTRREAQAIQRLLPQAQLYLGPEATKGRLLGVPTPGILHLATHGFFLEDAPQLPSARALAEVGALGEVPHAPRPSDPLLRSGLVFAGAGGSASGPGPSQPSPERSLVTALELAGLNLWGTQLVVLSACDTGRGDIKLGQGVYGLHRAFLVAGAETVIMSLWKVNDETTGALMEAYYQHLLAGQGRASALREAMRELRRTRPHPHHWAPFLAMGNDNPLRAITPTPRGDFGGR